MTSFSPDSPSFQIEKGDFTQAAVFEWRHGEDRRLANWPVVYVLSGNRHVYVGETISATSRITQHLRDDRKTPHVREVRIILDDHYNKSACLDLESHLIQWFVGDDARSVLNSNSGLTNSDYYGRQEYRSDFPEVFDQLRAAGLFKHTIPEIENSTLFKLSPFKALNEDQSSAVTDIVKGLVEDLANEKDQTIVIRGEPGTGKTIVGIYLMKLLADFQDAKMYPEVAVGSPSLAEIFLEENHELLQGKRIGIVVPQQSLRHSLINVFRKIPGLTPTMILTPYEVGKAKDPYDILIVDEAHRLTQYGAQSIGTLTRDFKEITKKLFGFEDQSKTQLDWIKKQSRIQILLLDSLQSVRPIDLPREVVAETISTANREGRIYELHSQMRVSGGRDYITHIRNMLGGTAEISPHFGEYDFRLFDNFSDLHQEILRRENEVGLSRILSGYAWEWVSKSDPSKFDIEIDGLGFKWNKATKDWINSPTSVDEVGSIHTVQGYDLNYAGVIIGNDLYFDPLSREVKFSRDDYYDIKGKSNNKMREIVYTDEDLSKLVKQIYRVLLTRGIKGTYVYVVDENLRELLRPFFPRVKQTHID